jgi:hypothetical protein
MLRHCSRSLLLLLGLGLHLLLASWSPWARLLLLLLALLQTRQRLCWPRAGESPRRRQRPCCSAPA